MPTFDDTELFENAMQGEQPAPSEAQPATPAQPEAPAEGQQRDERGRYAAAQQQEPEAPEQPAQPDAQPERAEDDAGDRPVPGKRFGEVTRARDEAIRRADEAERRAQEYERRIAAIEARAFQPQSQAQPEPAPDPLDAFLTNPQGFLAQRDGQVLEAVGEQIVRATPEGAKAYDDAYAAAQQMGPAFQPVYASIMAQPPINRARALVDWHRSYQAQQRVGADPDAFFQRTLEERLKSDPEFQKSLVERLTGQARQQPQGNGRPNVELPPSLSRIAPAAGVVDDPGDGSDAAIFSYAFNSR